MMDLIQSLRSWARRRTRTVTVAVLLIALSLFDWLVIDGWISRTAIEGWARLLSLAADDWPATRTVLGLVFLTCFLAFVNLYMKIAIKAPQIQRRLRPMVFANTPFAAYLGVYLLLSALAYIFLFENIEGPWLVPVAAAALLGIGVGNADIKFGGFSLLPLAEFLQGLEAVAQVGISEQVQELDIAKRASLRDQLAAKVEVSVLERECRMLGMEQAELDKLKQVAEGNNPTFAALLAREIVRNSELNAQRLIDLPHYARRP